MADPTDAVAVAEVEHVTGCRVEPVLMTVSAVEELVERTYRALVTEVMKRVGSRDETAGGKPEAAARAARGAGPAASGPLAATASGRPTGAGEGGGTAGGPEPTAPTAAGARTGAALDGPVTVPFHRLSDEADVETRLSALIQLLLAKRVVTEDEMEDEVRRLMRPTDENG